VVCLLGGERHLFAAGRVDRVGVLSYDVFGDLASRKLRLAQIAEVARQTQRLA